LSGYNYLRDCLRELLEHFKGPVKGIGVPEMTYNVFSGTLNPTHFTSLGPHF